jgi:hypothetical protein
MPGRSVEGIIARRANLPQLISNPNHRLYPAHPVPLEGRIMIVTDVGAGCGGCGSDAAQTFCADERR